MVDTSSRKSVALYLLLVIVISTPYWTLMIRAGSLELAELARKGLSVVEHVKTQKF